MFDYEFATLQHNIGCRPARRVITPDTIPPERLRRYGVGAEKLAQYPGLKEEYYLADFEPDRSVPERLGLDRERVVVVVRPPPDVSLYHRKSNPLFPQVLTHLGQPAAACRRWCCPRTDAQREYVRSLELPSVVVPEQAVDAQSLVALGDLVVSAGGTMNREAVALGTPVYTTYGGRLGGVDEALIREHRLRPLTDPRGLELEKRNSAGEQHAPRSGAAGRHDARRSPMSALPSSPGRRGRTAAGTRRPPSARRDRPERPARVARRALQRDGARGPRSTRGVDIALRALDLAIAGAALLVLSPGPGRDRGLDPRHLGRAGALPRQAGRAAPGRIFTMLKFRTLTAGRRGAARPVPRPRAHAAHADGGHAPRPRAALRPPRRAAAAVERRCAAT